MLFVIISIRFFSITICNLLIEFPSYLPYRTKSFLHLTTQIVLSRLRTSWLAHVAFVAFHRKLLRLIHTTRHVSVPSPVSKSFSCVFKRICSDWQERLRQVSVPFTRRRRARMFDGTAQVPTSLGTCSILILGPMTVSSSKCRPIWLHIIDSLLLN